MKEIGKEILVHQNLQEIRIQAEEKILEGITLILEVFIRYIGIIGIEVAVTMILIVIAMIVVDTHLTDKLTEKENQNLIEDISIVAAVDLVWLVGG